MLLNEWTNTHVRTSFTPICCHQVNWFFFSFIIHLVLLLAIRANLIKLTFITKELINFCLSWQCVYFQSLICQGFEFFLLIGLREWVLQQENVHEALLYINDSTLSIETLLCQILWLSYACHCIKMAHHSLWIVWFYQGLILWGHPGILCDLKKPVSS